jgi:hypothetical protein
MLRHLPHLAGESAMPKTTILVPAAIAAALLSATVFAGSPGTETTGLIAKAPNRAEVFAASTCSDAAVAVVQAASWNDALATKRALDRDLVLASVAAQGCAVTGK